MNCKIEISTPNPSWKTCEEQINSRKIAIYLKIILNRYNIFRNSQQIELSLLLTDNAEIKKLNFQFRNINKTTNVLSFPDNHISWKNINALKTNNGYLYLGDIAFAYEYILQESILLKKEFFEHFKHLFVHSVLHLIGYNHLQEEEADLMEYLEQDMLKDFYLSKNNI
ncbi:MAG: rRNA maturation RNase YbeY [Rickettsia sp.]|nr:rRNA maturation RNase YbeY [Rickettsia sp.]